MIVVKVNHWMRDLLQSKLPNEWSIDLRNGDD